MEISEATYNHIVDEVVRLKLILLDVVNEYGIRGEYGGVLFTREYQPPVIQSAMDAIKEVMP